MKKLLLPFIIISLTFFSSCIDHNRNQYSSKNESVSLDVSNEDDAPTGPCLVCQGEGSCIFEGVYYEQCPCCNGSGQVSQEVIDAVNQIIGVTTSSDTSIRTQIEQEIRNCEIEIENYRSILQNTTSGVYEAYYTNEITNLEYKIKSLRIQLQFMD